MKKYVRIIIIACIVFAGVWTGTDWLLVHAEEDSTLYVSEQGDFIAEYEADIRAYRGDAKKAPVAVSEGYADWIFAGWYTDSSCEQQDAIKAGTNSGGAWAKYVPGQVLSVKCQVKTDATDTDAESTSMRLISSVDTLAYENVGFEVMFGSSGPVTEVTMDTVYERIHSGNKSEVECQFNPKIVDVESQYFVTATLKNIQKKNYDEILLIRPYWETLDGTKVYGESRYVKVSDYWTPVVNISIKTSTRNELLTVSVVGETVGERRYFEGQSYGALMVEVEDVDALASATEYQISNGVKEIYRNLYTTYNGTSDTSWYSLPERDKYVLTSLADVYGFAELVNAGKSFHGKTVYLGTDISINEGSSSDWETQEPSRIWTPIGVSKDTPFDGAFDGFFDSVSGIYMAGNVYEGFFGYVEHTGTVQNLEICNSYYVSGDETKTIGGVVAHLRGNVSNLYVGEDVLLRHNGSGGVSKETGGTGGIVGYFENEGIETTGVISECWFAGKAYSKRASVAGILGHAYRGNLKIINCLNTGTITSSFEEGDGYAYAAGLIGGGRSWNGDAGMVIELNACVNTGSVTVNEIYAIGSVMGRNITTTTTIKNVYTTDDVINAEGEEIFCDGTISGIGHYSLTAGKIYGMPLIVEESELFGKDGYASLDLDYYSKENVEGVWAAIDGQAPELQAFTKQTVVKDFSDVERELTGWYYNAFTYSCKIYSEEGGTSSYPAVNTQTKYEISNADELAGLRKLVNSGIDDFGDLAYEKPETVISGRTITLANDIVINDGSAEDWAEGKNLPAFSWKPIGLNNESQKFSGIFDGKGHTISGVYAVDKDKVDEEYNYLGLFAIVSPSSTIQNVRVKNSYFRQEVPDGFVGSIACDIQGVIQNVYSDAIIDSYGQQTGGICARMNGLEYIVSGSVETDDVVMGRGSMTMDNCWFDGVVRALSYTQSSHYVGGLAGVLVQGDGTISNSLFTGKIEGISTSKTVYIGGLAGSAMAQTSIGYQENSESNLKLISCISAGDIDAPSGFRGATMGRVINGISGGKANHTYVTIQNVFATRECWPAAINVKGDYTSGGVTAKAVVTGTIIQTQETDRLIGYCTEEGTLESLDYTNDWSMRTAGVSIPKCMEDQVPDSELAEPSNLTEELALDYWSGELADAVDYGIGNYVLQYSATKTTYQTYLSKLANLGFEKYADNSAGTLDDDGIYNATYVKEEGDWVVSVTYVTGESKIYISISTIGRENISPNLQKTVQSGTGQVMYAMVGLSNSSGYGNGFVFQLSNGHFIVIDGGMSADGPNLINYLRELSGDGSVYIDAWVISHYHGDHSAAFNQLASNASLREGIYIEAVYSSESSNYSKATDGGAIATANNAYLALNALTKADGSEPDNVRMHMGERYYFAGVTMDVIQAQEQLKVSSYNAYSDPDKFNATSTVCMFQVTATGDKIFTGGDATKANMNYIMKAYDGITATAKRYNEMNGWYTDTDPAEITRTTTKTLSDISVFVAYHHGKNTTNAFTRYLVGSEDDEYTFKIALFPFHQMMNPTLYETYIYNGTTYKNRYWMEDNSCVFNYKMEEVNRALLANVTEGFYTYGYEDSVEGATADNWHGTVELYFTSSGIQTRVLKSWRSGFTMEEFE